MPHGGARPGAGRKPTPLPIKLGIKSMPNQLKVEKPAKTPKQSKPPQKPKPPEYLSLLQVYEGVIPSPEKIFKDTIDFLHYGNYRYTAIIPADLIVNYAMMAHFSAAVQYNIEEQKSAMGHEFDEKTAIAHANAIMEAMECKRIAWKPIQDIINRIADIQMEFARKYKAEIDESWAEAALYRKARKTQ